MFDFESAQTKAFRFSYKCHLKCLKCMWKAVFHPVHFIKVSISTTSKHSPFIVIHSITWFYKFYVFLHVLWWRCPTSFVPSKLKIEFSNLQKKKKEKKPPHIEHYHEAFHKQEKRIFLILLVVVFHYSMKQHVCCLLFTDKQQNNTQTMHCIRH